VRARGGGASLDMVAGEISLSSHMCVYVCVSGREHEHPNVPP
jgi:hypothetical protein